MQIVNVGWRGYQKIEQTSCKKKIDRVNTKVCKNVNNMAHLNKHQAKISSCHFLNNSVLSLLTRIKLSMNGGGLSTEG